MRLDVLGISLCVSLAVSGCAARGAVRPIPTSDEVQAVRVLAVRVADATTAGLTILRDTGRLLDSLPLSVEAKDRYDCSILAVTGTTGTPSATVTRVCGPVVKTAANAPLPMALAHLRTVSSCPSLRATMTSIQGWTTPLIQQLIGSDNAALRTAGLSLNAVFGLLTSGEAATCSV